MKRPKISVVMSVYNGEKYLKESIKSILNQKFTDFEFIIINDGSTDQTGRILNSFNDDRLVIIEQKNLGITKSLNKGISLAKGKYIARMDDSDISDINRLRREIFFLENNREYVLVGTRHYIINENGHLKKTVMLALSYESLAKILPRYNQIAHGSILLRKDAFVKIGGYREIFTYCQDYDLYLRLLHKYKLCNINYIGYKWREENKTKCHNVQIIKTKYRTFARLLYFERIFFGKEISYKLFNIRNEIKMFNGAYIANNYLKEMLRLLVKKDELLILIKHPYLFHFVLLVLLYITGLDKLLFKLNYFLKSSISIK